MPHRSDLNKILILGSGPIVIGQACEFDYSGTQACRALKALGYQVVLVNSNPATIMTDPELADRTYIEPITVPVVERVIQTERPDALLPTLGGQTALNVAVGLAEAGALERHDVELIGASLEAIRRAEDREAFKATMLAAGLALPRSADATSVDGALEAARALGYPVIVRPSFTLGGGGSGMAETPEALAQVAAQGIDQSPISQVLIEESVLGWKEYELEVIRDRLDNAMVICSIENVDPMGVHTGDSMTVAPALTLTDRCYQELRDQALTVVRAIGVDTGGSNIQFAVHPDDGRVVVIEMNPRVSRSSALASKATGYPIAKVAAMLAVGMTLDEIPNDITKTTPASFEPAIDYCVVKIPRFPTEKFAGAKGALGTQMKSVGEVMAIGRTFEEALMKGLRSLDPDGVPGACFSAAADADTAPVRLAVPHVARLFDMARALDGGASVEAVADQSGIDAWFVHALQDLVTLEREIVQRGPAPSPEFLRHVKRAGFGDEWIGRVLGLAETEVRRLRLRSDVRPTMKAVDTCAGEIEATTPYFYSTYEDEDEATPSTEPTVVVLGAGANRIGQGIEFDYCCVQAAQALGAAGYRVVMVNSNPETVSTDYDASDRLYFEPLCLENVLDIVEHEGALGVVVQFGGQTPLALAAGLVEAGVQILGTSLDAIDRAENRERVRELVAACGLDYPAAGAAQDADDARRVAERLGYPLLVRPSYVLGGRGMRVVVDAQALEALLADPTVVMGPERPLMLDAFLEDAIEVDMDAVADGERVVVGPVLEHIEEAGVHSGDSSCVTPPFSIGDHMAARLRQATRQLALELGVRGLMNVQFAIKGDRLYVLELNPRASRTVPFVSKATGVPLARWAARVMVGESLPESLAPELEPVAVCIKKPVYPFHRFPGEDTLLGPEMKSTGEVMGIGNDLGHAFAKALMADGGRPPERGGAFISVRDRDKRAVVFIAKRLHDLGFELLATEGTGRLLEMNGLPVRRVYKVHEAPDQTAVQAIQAGDVQLVINTPLGRPSRYDERAIRRAALDRGVLCLTTIPGAALAVEAIEALGAGPLEVTALQDTLEPVVSAC